MNTRSKIVKTSLLLLGVLMVASFGASTCQFDEIRLSSDEVSKGEYSRLSYTVQNNADSSRDVRFEMYTDGKLSEIRDRTIGADNSWSFFASISAGDDRDGDGDVQVRTETTGCGEETDSDTVYIRDDRSQWPVSRFSNSPENPVPGQTVEMDFTGQDAQNNIRKVVWRLGDDTKKYGHSIEHTYDQEGLYKVLVTAVDSHGNKDTFSETVEVRSELDADLKIDPNQATVGDKVEFDASQSTGDTEVFRFDFDNDGTYDLSTSDEIVYRQIDEQFFGEAKVQVEDRYGNTDTALQSYTVEYGGPACDIQGGYLRLERDLMQQGESQKVRINAYNGGEPQKVRATFRVNGVEVSTQSRTIEGPETFTASVSPDEDATVSATLDTLGSPCGDQEITTDSARIDVYKPREDGRLNVLVEDSAGDVIEDARVELSSESFNEIGSTGSDGETYFTAPSGYYTVEASKDRYSTDSKRVRLEEGGETTLVLALRETNQESALRVVAEDEEGDRLENADIEIRNGEDLLKRTNSRGVAEFDLEEGSYDLTATRTGYSIENREIEVTSGEDQTVTIQFSPLDDREEEDAALSVRVEDEFGDPLEDATVEVENGDFESDETNSQGRSTFDLEPDTYEVTVSRSNYRTESRTVTLDEGDIRTLTFELERRDTDDEAELDVLVEDEDNDPIDEATVRVRNGETDVEETDRNGRAEFTLEADRYDVRVSASGYYTEEREVDLDEGDSRTLRFELEERDGFDEDASLEVVVEDEDSDPIEDARVRVENGDDDTEFTDDDGEARFDLEADSYDIFVSADGFRSRTRFVTLDEGEFRTERFELRDEDDRQDDARLDVTVRDDDFDRLEDARVEVENGDRDVEFTDDDGEARFFLEPDRYDVEVSADGFRTEDQSIRLFEDDREELDFVLERGDDGDRELSFAGFGYSNVACRGEDYEVTVNVRNSGSRDTVEIELEGLGDSDTTAVSIGRDDIETRTLTLRDVEGSGSESFEVTLSNGEVRTASRSITVENCGTDGGGDIDEPSTDATSISAEVEPDQITLGESVKVSGYVDGTRGRAPVDVFIGGRKVADISTQPDGYYQTFVRPQNIGNLEVRAESGDRSAVNQVNVLPNVAVTSLSAPERVFENDEFEICSNVESAADARVVLLEDGEAVQTRNGNGEICFDVESSEGEKEFTVRGYAGGNQDSLTREIEVLPLDNEVENFPDRLAMVRTGDGIVRVSLYNTNDQERRYDLEMEGIPEDWFSQTEKTAILTPGERRDVYFYVTPEAEGDFDADLSVSSDGDRIYQQQIAISSGGTTDSNPDESFLDRLVALFRL